MVTQRAIRIQITNRYYLAVRSDSLDPAETPLPPLVAGNLVQKAILAPKDLRGLHALSHAILGTGSHGGAIRLPLIKTAFQSGKWVLLPQSNGALQFPAAAAESAAQQVKTAKLVKTWIEVEVVDEQGRPAPGRQYVCMLPDGVIESGTLDQKGRVRFEGIDPGNCVFSLVGMDQEAWKRA